MYHNRYFATVSSKDFTVISSYLTKTLYTISFNREEMKFAIDGNTQFACGNIIPIANAILKHESGMLDTEGGKKEFACYQTGTILKDDWQAVYNNPSQYQHFVGIAIVDALETAHDNK